MTTSRFILLGVVSSFVFFGCNRSAPTGFRLTVQEVASSTDARAALLTIQTANEGTISIDKEGGHSSVVLSDPNASGTRVGSVALLASRIAPPGDGDIYIQTLIQPQTPNGAYAGGASIYTLPRATKLVDHFAITAKVGEYPLDTPTEIARFQGKPVMLTVGKPTK
jgi:hypothetical protein